MNERPSIVSDISVLVVGVVIVLGLVFLGVKLKEVQIEGAADWKYDNSRQSTRRVLKAGERGRILARDGEVLAENRRSYSIFCTATPYQKRTWEQTVAELSRAISSLTNVIGAAACVTDKDLSRHVSRQLPIPLEVCRELDSVAIARFCEHERDFPGFECVPVSVRRYPFRSLAAHVIGYVGREKRDVTEGDEKYNFRDEDMSGRSGLEARYDEILRGVPGERRVRVDARGFALDGETVVEPGRGLDIVTTIDLEVQREVERQLRGLRGACAVIDPRDGSVLALASAPAYDLNKFVPRIGQAAYSALAEDPGKPLLNRAIGGSYAPGSTFKPVTALAGLGAGWDGAEKHECIGSFVFGGMKIHCSRTWGHGELDVRGALRDSCNPFFCNLGVFAGTNALIRTAKTFGLGSRTGIDLGGEAAGIVPDADWKERTYHERWFPGDLAQMSIGQGMLLATPLQMARIAGAIGTGYLVKPRLVLNGEPEKSPLPFPAHNLELVRSGMRMVVDGGTGRRAGDGVATEVAGKTGTAEVGRGASRRKNTWFIAYAPASKPTVAIAMVIENGDSGGGTTAPRVRNILARIFGEGSAGE